MNAEEQNLLKTLEQKQADNQQLMQTIDNKKFPPIPVHVHREPMQLLHGVNQGATVRIHRRIEAVGVNNMILISIFCIKK
jgi:hypothetical protein